MQSHEIAAKDSKIQATSDVDVTLKTDKQSSKKLPDNQLTEDILYKYMLAEVATQHHDYEVAFYHFMDLSESTYDPRIAKSALRAALVLGNRFNIFKALQLWSELELQRETNAEAMIDILQIRAVILFKVEKDDLATLDLLKIIALTPNREQAITRAGVILSTLSDYARLKKILKLLNKDFHDNFYFNQYYAQFALQYDDFKQAEKSINKLLVLEEKNETAYLLKAKLYTKKKQQQEALKWYQKGIEEVPNPSLLRLEYSKLLLQLKQHQKAIEQLQYIVDENKDNKQNANILYSIGMLSMEIKEYPQASLFFTKLYHLKNHHDQGAFLLGVLAYTLEKNEIALQWFDKVKGEKYHYESVLRKAIIYSEKKQYQTAVSLLNSYSVSNSSSDTDSQKTVNLLRLKADILNRAQRYNEAYEAYTKALSLKPHHAELLYGRAMVAEKLDRIDLSEQDLLLIIEKDPENSNAFNALGFILTEKTTRYKDAKKYIEQALKIMPNDMAILDSMGWVLYKLGRLEESLKYLKLAYDLQQDPEVAAHYGEVLWSSDKKEQAKQIWQSALLKNPEHGVLKSTMTNYLTP